MWREEENTVEGLVFVDSQAALKALQSNTPVSGHQIADAIHSAYERVMAKHPRAKITFRWVATYKECEGNEIADKQAKLASSGDQDSPAEDLPELLRSRLGCSESAMEIGVMKGPKKRATAVLQSSKQREKLEEIDSSMPSTKFRKVQVGMSRGQAALYIQLCIGHVPLDKHIFSLHVRERLTSMLRLQHGTRSSETLLVRLSCQREDASNNVGQAGTRGAFN